MSGFRLKCSCRALGQMLLFLALTGLIQAEEKANAPKLAPLAPFEKYAAGGSRPMGLPDLPKDPKYRRLRTLLG